MLFYNKHVFICTNFRENGECCENHKATDVVAFIKSNLKIKDPDKKSGIKISNSGCLGRCKNGPVLVIYPEGKWCTYSSKKEVEQILDSILSDNEIPEKYIF